MPLVASLRILELLRLRMKDRRMVSNMADLSRVKVLVLGMAARRSLALTRCMRLVIRL